MGRSGCGGVSWALAGSRAALIPSAGWLSACISEVSSSSHSSVNNELG